MTAGQVERLERGWVRRTDEWTTGGYPLSVHLAGCDDTSPVHRTYPTGYDSRCGWCWLNAPHSGDAHAMKVGGVR